MRLPGERVAEDRVRNAYIVWEGRKMSQGGSRRMWRNGVTEPKGGNIREVWSTVLEEWQGPGNAYLT